MNTLRPLITLCIFVLLTGFPAASSAGAKAITMTLPETVINEAIQKTLPVNIPIKSGTILGSVSIDAIKHLKIQKNKLSSQVILSAHKLNLVTSIAGHDLRMKIGSLTMNFRCDATIRFDAKNQTLFLRPVISELHSSDKAKTEVATMVAQLFNNHEFPLQLERLKPIMADTGNKMLNISMRINTISLQPGTMQLQIIPRITATAKQKKTKHKVNNDYLESR